LSEVRGMSRGKLPRARPRYEFESDLPPERIVQDVRAFFRENDRIKGLALPHRIEMAFSGDEQHLWSPQLIADLHVEGSKTRLSVRFGPHPHVWGMYMAGYFILGTLTLIASSYGFSQLTLGQSPTALFVLPVLTVLLGLLYGASFVGQGLGFDQMVRLRDALQRLAGTREVEEGGS
jgi:hypothetical protein